MHASASHAPSARGLPTPDPALLGEAATPCYLFDTALVIEELAALREALATPVVVSVKACPVLDVLVRSAHALGDGIELASMGELNLTVGRLSVPRWLNTPALDEQLTAAALACRATIIADSPAQLAMIERAHAPALARGGQPLPVVLRVNAEALLQAGPGHADHFGMDLPTLHAEIDRLRKGSGGLRVGGLHVFAGSHSFARSAVPLAQRLDALLDDLAREHGVQPEDLLIGSGLPADWRGLGDGLAHYRQVLQPLQARARVRHECGRAVFARAGSFATRVVGVKRLRDRTIVVCDGGMAQCFALAQTEQFVRRPRRARLVRAGVELPGAPAGAAPAALPLQVVGNSCNRADVIGELDGGLIPERGDMLLFDLVGAYHSYSPSGFLNLRPARHYLAS